MNIVQISFSRKSGITMEVLREKMNKMNKMLVEQYGEGNYEVRSCHLSKELCLAKGFSTEIPDLFAEVFADRYVSEVAAESEETVMESMNSHRVELSEKADKLFIIIEGMLTNVSTELSLFTNDKVVVL